MKLKKAKYSTLQLGQGNPCINTGWGMDRQSSPDEKGLGMLVDERMRGWM